MRQGAKVGGEAGDSKDGCTDLRKLKLNLAPTEEEKRREIHKNLLKSQKIGTNITRIANARRDVVKLNQNMVERSMKISPFQLF